MAVLILTLIICFLIAIVLGIVIPVYKGYYRVTNGTVNHDPLMQNFVYKVDLTKDEIISKLRVPNATLDLRCSLKPDNSIITFYEYGCSADFALSIEEQDGFSIFKLSKLSLFTTSQIPLKLNPYMVEILGAEIIPFSNI